MSLVNKTGHLRGNLPLWRLFTRMASRVAFSRIIEGCVGEREPLDVRSYSDSRCTDADGGVVHICDGLAASVVQVSPHAAVSTTCRVREENLQVRVFPEQCTRCKVCCSHCDQGRCDRESIQCPNSSTPPDHKGLVNITTTEAGVEFSCSGERRTKSPKSKVNKERRRVKECLSWKNKMKIIY